MQYCFSLLFLLSFCFVSAQSNTINLEAEKRPLEEVIAQLEQENGFLFSFKTEDIQNIQVSIRAKGMDLNTFLTRVFSQNGLDFEIIEGNYIILKKAVEKEKILPLLSGTVIDSLTGEGLSFANVYLKKIGQDAPTQGTSTDKEGKFYWRTVFDKKDTLVISYVGYKEIRLPVTDFTKGASPVVGLGFLDFGDDFVVVTDYLTDGIDLGERGTSTIIRPNKMAAMPGQAEADVLQSIQFLPGISSPDEQASDIYIRGGTPDQNLVLWEDIPIYHSAHYFDMISAFNPYIMNKVKVYRSGFSAIHGGRISGVLDLKSDDYSLKKSNYGIGSNLTHAYLYGKSAILKNKLTVVFSLRRSIRELWNSPTFDNITQRNLQGLLPLGNIDNLPSDITINTNFNFLDANLKASIRPSNQDEVTAAWFYGLNDFNNHVDDDRRQEDLFDKLDLFHQGISLAWKHEWSKRFSSKMMGIRSHLNYDYSFDAVQQVMTMPNHRLKKRNEVIENKLQFDHTYTSIRQHQFNAGYHYTNGNVSYEFRQDAQQINAANEKNKYHADLHALYVEYISPPQHRFHIQSGLRLNYYLGTKQTYLEPRLQLGYRLSDHIQLHANAGQYHQFMSRLIEFKTDEAGIDNPIWILSGAKDVLSINREIPVLQAQQYQVGVVFDKKSWVIDIQSYYKKISGLTSLSVGFDEIPKEEYDRGISTIRGIDFLIKKRWRNYRTWLSYTLSKVDYDFNRFSMRTFPASYDQRHFLQWANLFKVRNFELSLGWKLASGKPYTLITGHRPGMSMNNGPRAIYGDFNGERLPLQHHLDASISYHFKTKSAWKGVIGLSFFNIYNQRNVYNRTYFLMLEPQRPPVIESRDKETLGFMPNAVFRMEW